LYTHPDTAFQLKVFLETVLDTVSPVGALGVDEELPHPVLHITAVNNAKIATYRPIAFVVMESSFWMRNELSAAR